MADEHANESRVPFWHQQEEVPIKIGSMFLLKFLCLLPKSVPFPKFLPADRCSHFLKQYQRRCFAMRVEDRPEDVRAFVVFQKCERFHRQVPRRQRKRLRFPHFNEQVIISRKKFSSGSINFPCVIVH